MSKSLFSLICTLESFVQGGGKKRKSDLKRAERYLQKLRENYSLTEKQVQWVGKLYM